MQYLESRPGLQIVQRGPGIAGDQQYRQTRPSLPRGIGDLASVDPRQSHVGDQYVERLVRQHDFQAGGPIGGFAHLISLFDQGFHDLGTHARLVLHDQNRGVGSGLRRRGGIPLRRHVGFRRFWRPVLGRMITGQVQMNARPLTRRAFKGREPSGLAHEAIDLRQSKPCSLPHGFRREKRFEGPGFDSGRHAGPVVRDTYKDIIARLGILMFREIGGRQAHIRSRDDQLPTLGHRVAGIDGQIEQRVFQLTLVREGGPLPVVQAQLQMYYGTDGMADQFRHAIDQRIRLHRPGQQRLPP